MRRTKITRGCERQKPDIDRDPQGKSFCYRHESVDREEETFLMWDVHAGLRPPSSRRTDRVSEDPYGNSLPDRRTGTKTERRVVARDNIEKVFAFQDHCQDLEKDGNDKRP